MRAHVCTQSAPIIGYARLMCWQYLTGAYLCSGGVSLLHVTNCTRTHLEALGQSLELQLVDSFLFRICVQSRHPVQRHTHIRRHWLGVCLESQLLLGLDPQREKPELEPVRGEGTPHFGEIVPLSNSERAHQHQRESAPTIGMVSSLYC